MLERYHLLVRILHWLMAPLFLFMLGLGLYMTGMPLSPTKLQVYAWHKWLGVSLFILILLRIISRFCSKTPAQPAHMSLTMQWLAKCGHVALYLLMLAAPLSGWLMSSAKGFQTVWFGVIPLPDLLDKNADVAEALLLAHQWINYVFIVTITGHILAALKHQFIDKDQLFKRISLSSAKD